MNITAVIAAVIVGGTGLSIGVFLGLAGKKFAVEVDEREEAILGVPPEITVAVVDMPDAPALPLKNCKGRSGSWKLSGRRCNQSQPRLVRLWSVCRRADP